MPISDYNAFPMCHSCVAEDRTLIRDLLEAKPQAWDRLVGRVADPVWTVCRLLSANDDDAHSAFGEVIDALRADGFRRLRPYDGSSRLETFAVLLTREILAERLLHLLRPDGDADAWTAFETFFAADIRRIILRRLPGAEREDARRDAYQDICLALVADNYRRLRAYRGVGSFGGFVLHMVDRLLIDSIRRTVPRRRAESSLAIVTVPLEDHEEMPAEQPSPEEAVLTGEHEQLLARASKILREAADALSEAERLYLHVALGGGEPLPAREVARLMRRPIEEVYKLKQRAMARLREALEKNPDVKLWRASV